MDVLMKRTCETCAMALLLLVFASAVPAAGPVAAKPAESAAAPDPWVGFGPGSWVEIRSTNVTETKGKPVTSIVGTKITLLEKSADKITLENEFTTNGQTIRSKFDQPLKNCPEELPDGMTVLSTGRETLTIAGKPLDCETLEATMNQGGKVHFKRWTSGKVPGSLVKMETSSSGSHGTTEVVGFKAY
jgi:hypothetical protein